VFKEWRKMKMNKNFKSKLIKALRSGKYKQADGQLRTSDNKFCCLGVACDIQNPDKWHKIVPTSKLADKLNVENGYVHGKQDILLSNWMRNRIGISEKEQDILIKMNDDSFTFKQIADYIEKNL
jgi:hypothetical protein